MISKHTAMAPKGAYCFGCNQPFDGGSPALQFQSDLVPPSDQPELAGLYFHPKHLVRYASRRNWSQLVEFINQNGVANY